MSELSSCGLDSALEARVYTLRDVLAAYEAGRASVKIRGKLPPIVVVRPPQIIEIQERVAAYFCVPQVDMVSGRRAREVARPRQVAMYLSVKLTKHSYPTIGRHFGNRDHTTVIHAVRVVEQLAASDADFGARVEDLKQVLGGGQDGGGIGLQAKGERRTPAELPA